MTAAMVEQVRRRARNLCEYCRMPDTARRLPFQIDHIIALQHAGQTVLSNLAYACGRCNRAKGPNLSGFDPDTRQISRLFDPRGQRWGDHFRFSGSLLVGLTPTGRATIHTLQMNHPNDLLLREALLLDGSVFDTSDPLL